MYYTYYYLVTYVCVVICCITFSNALQAQHNDSSPICNIMVYTEKSELFQLYCNDVLINEEAKSIVKAKYFTTDTILIRVVFDNASLGVLNATIFPKLGYEEIYSIAATNKPSNASTKTLLHEPFIQYGVYFQSAITAMHPNNIKSVTTTRTTEVNGVKTSITTSTKPKRFNTTQEDANNNANKVCTKAVSNEIFMQLISQLKAEKFDVERLSLSKDFIANNCLSVQQIKGLLTNFTYESTRLDLAAFAYVYVLDNADYAQQLRSGFIYEDSAKKLRNQLKLAYH